MVSQKDSAWVLLVLIAWWTVMSSASLASEAYVNTLQVEQTSHINDDNYIQQTYRLLAGTIQ